MVGTSSENDDNNSEMNKKADHRNFENNIQNPSGYITKKGISKYSNALKHLLPYRKNKVKKNTLSVDGAGLFSLITFSWLTKYIFKAYKKGLTLEDIPLCSPLDSCDLNAARLQHLWEEELISKGPSEASFGWAIWRFVRTRVIISCITFSISCVMGFLSPTIFMRKLLEFLEDPNQNQVNGFMWALALTSAEILRTMFFALYYSLSYRTALRLRSACLAMVYQKMLRLHSARNTSAGVMVNLFGFDGPRLYYMIVFGPMAIGGPIISICGFFYVYYILGTWALLGMLIFVSYYPLQYLLSHLTGRFRRYAVTQTDKRIKLVTEILTNIRIIKMYAWEKWFSSQVADIRKKELKEVEKIAYCQSFGISLAPTIPVISGIATFLIHVATGGNLTASQAFSVLVFMTKQMKISIQVIRDGTLCFYEGISSVKRFKVI